MNPIDRTTPGRRWAPDGATAWGPVAVLLLCSTQALGGVTWGTTLVVTGLVLAIFTWQGTRQALSVTGLAWVLLGLAAVSLLQAVPLPVGLVAAVAPANAEVWQRTLVLLEQPPGWVPLSIEPDATRLEALRYAAYAGFALGCAGVQRRFGGRPLSAVVVGSALVLQLVTLGHQLGGATSVFGLYQPSHSNFVGPLMNPNNLGGYLNLGFFCAAGLALDPRSTQNARRATIAACVVLVAGVVWAASRGAVLVLAGGILVLFLVLSVVPRKSLWAGRSKPGLLAVGISLGVLFAGFSAARLRDNLGDTSLEKLSLIWPALKAALEYPLLGAGRGAFGPAVSPHVPAKLGHGSFEHAENFLLQWSVDLGLPITLALTALLLVWLWPRAETLRATPVKVGAYLGLVGLWLHNLVDLSLEVPAVVLAAIATAFAIRSRRDAQPEHDTLTARLNLPRARVAISVATGLFGVGMLTWCWLSPGELARSARARVAQASNAGQLTTQEIHAALARHPADAFLLRLGAAARFQRGEEAALRWIGWSIARDPISGRSLVLLADILHARAATDQALGALRRAVTVEPALAAEVAPRAIAWFPENALAMVPEGPAGARVLSELANRVVLSQDRLRYRLLAVERWEPGSVSRSTLWHSLLLDALSATDEDCQSALNSPCAAFAKARLSHAWELDAATGVEVEALLLAREGNPAAAFEQLYQRCPKTHHGCLRRLLGLAHAVPLEQHREALRIWLATACGEPKGCAQAEVEAAASLDQRGERRGALSHLQRAATLDPSAERWTQVAQRAMELRDLTSAEHALRNLTALGGTLAPELLEGVRRLRLDALSTP